MQRLFSDKVSRWLLPAFLILFILEVITLPLVLGVTYSGRSESPDHTLTYTPGRLTWDKATGIDENGVAQLDLFDAVYPGVEAENGDNVVAPGTEGYNIIRLKNGVGGSIKYTAVLYRIRTNDALPVEADLVGDYTDTEIYPLPEEVTEEQVLRAVSGFIRGGEIIDFDISWLWEFYTSDEQDQIDVALGNGEDTVTVGLYIVVEDDNDYSDDEDPPKLPGIKDKYIKPAPYTGDDNGVGTYIALMAISFIVLLLLMWDRRKEKQ